MENVPQTEGRRHCMYTANTRSLYQVVYDCAYFVARRPREDKAASV